MLRQWKCFFIILTVTCWFSVTSTAQNTYGSEADLKKQAAKLFEDGEFIKAYPLFSQLLALYPKDPNFNYKFGVCMLYSVADKEKAIPYIEYASKSPDVDKEVFYYLGRAYHLNYRFNDAITAYVSFKQKVSEKQAEKLQVDIQIKQCANGKKLLKNLTDIVVLNKKELSRANFYDAYNLTEFNAKLIVKPDDFKTSLDKKKNETSIMYQEQGKDVIYFSSYGEDGKMGKDIYVKRKLPNGEYGKPMNVGYPINTEADEDYPFLHPNGKILYFSSKGHNSMGGYDIFKSEYNESTGTWSKPVNMDFAINTPDDDILFISDAEDKIGYFASTRTSSGDMINVYKIVIDRKPADIAIVKGRVLRPEDAANGLSAKITVKNLETGQIVGIFNSKDKTGDYLLNLPNGGKFQFIVDAPGYKQYTKAVEIPQQFELKPLGQEILIHHTDGKENIEIVDKFDQNVSDEDYLYAMDFIKQRASLDVNYDQQQDTTDNTKPPDTSSHNVKPPPVNFSNDDIVKIAYTDAKDAQKDANELRKDADNSQYISNQKNDELNQKQKDLDAQQQVVDNTTDPQKKQSEQEKYDAMKKDLDLTTQQTILSNNMTKKLNDDAKKKQEDADFSLKYAKDLERAIHSSGTNDEVITQLNNTKQMLDDKMKKEKSGTDDFYADIKKQSDDKQRDADRTKQKVLDIQTEITQTESEIVRVKTEADKQKNEELKKSLLDQVDEMNTDLDEKKKQLVVTKKKADDLQKDADNIKTQADYTDDLIVQINNANNGPIVTNDPKNPVTNNPPKTDYTVKTNDLNKKYEQQIKDADFIPNELDRETKKTEIYANWSKDAKKEQDDLKKKIATTTDPTEKKKMQDQVLALNTIVTDKNKDSQTSKTNADKLKTLVTNPPKDTTHTNVVVTNNPPKDTTHPTTNVSDKTVLTKLNTSIKESENTVTQLNKKYDDELKTTDNITDPLQKEMKKSEILKKWNDDLLVQTTLLQKQLDTAKNINLSDKIAMQGSVNKIKDQQVETQKLETKSEKKVDELKVIANNPPKDTTHTNVVVTNNPPKDTTHTNVVVTNNPPKDTTHTNVVVTNNPPVTYTENFTKQIDAIDTVKNEYKKETAKTEVYENWVKSLTNDKDSLQKVLANTKKKDEKKKLNEQITVLNTRLIEKQKLADESRSNALTAKTTQDNLVVTNNPPVNNTVIDPSYNYTSKQASDDVMKVKDLVNQSNNLDKRSDSIKTVANNTQDPNKRVELFDLSGELKKQADQKRIDSYTTLADANQKEFTKNQDELTDLSKKTYDNDVTMLNAEKLKDESIMLFKDAQKTREDAKQMTGQDKVNALNHSNELEIQALNKQTESKKIYASMKVVAVIDNTVVTNNPPKDTTHTNVVVTNNPPKDTTHTNVVVTNNPPKDTIDHTVVTNTNPEIVKTDEYKKYTELKTDAQKQNDIALTNYKQSDELQKQAKDKQDESQRLIEGTATEPDDNKKNFMLKKADKLDAEALKLLAQSDSLKGVAKQVEADANTKQKDADAYLQTVDKTKSDQIIAQYKIEHPVTNNTVVTNNPPVNDHVVTKDPPVNDHVVTNNPPVNDHVVTNDPPVNTVTDKIVVKPVNVYSNNKPIPINTKLPEGLIFKVQVGAFKNPIPQNLFKGLSPLTGETTASGLTRYTAGVFTKIENANNAKQQIRDMGYKDAFVVAFLNGKRISYEDAMAMLNGKTPPDTNGQVVTNTPPVNDHVITNNPPVNDHVVTNDPPVHNVQVNDVKSVDVKSVQGLFYTVQVGVYSRKVTSAQLYGIKPLNSENVNNLIRYTSGIYNNVNDAISAKNKIVAKGVTDAFVTAYYNGQRITLDQAAQLLAQKGNSILSGTNVPTVEDPHPDNDPPVKDPVIKNDPPVKDPVIKNDPPVKDPVIKNDPPVKDPVETPVDTTHPKTPYVAMPNTAPVDSGIVFKVQIGAFKDEVPIDIANKYIRIQNQGIKNYVNESGLTVYTVGSFRGYADAEKTRSAVIEQGMSDAFVIAFKDGKKIPVEDAKKEAGE